MALNLPLRRERNWHTKITDALNSLDTRGTRGSSTIADASSSVVVTHGHAITPVSVTVTPRSGELVWVSSRTLTTFTVTRAGTAGALVFDWRAEI